MNILKRINRKKGVAIFFVLFIMIILGSLFVAFYSSSRQAQYSVYLYHTSETARQLAASAQEEAFNYLCDQTDNPNGTDYEQLNDIQKKIIDRNSILMSGVNRSKEGIPLKVPLTESIADSRLDISATARLVDFRNTDFDGHKFFDKEFIGTLEILVTVKPKDKYKNQFPGSCTIVRHHDIKVVNILSKASDEEGNRYDSEGNPVYAGSSILDYVLFVRKGQEEFEQTYGKSINPNIKLEINAEGDSNYLGKINFGTGNTHNYFNISKDTKKYVDNIDIVKTLGVAEGSIFTSIFPGYASAFSQAEAKAVREVEEAIRKEDAKPKGVKARIFGYKVRFYQKKLAVTDESVSGDMINIRSNAAQIALNKGIYVTNDHFFDGIKIMPEDKLDRIFNSDIRKLYLNYGYMVADLTGLQINVSGKAEKKVMGHKESKSFNETKSVAQGTQTYTCYDEELSSNDGGLNNNYLRNYIKGQGWQKSGFTYLNDDYAFKLPSNNDSNLISNSQNFFNNDFESGKMPIESVYPYAHFNLFSKRELNINYTSDTEDELEELGILKDNVLNLRGIVHCSKPVTLGNIKIKGSGVLIANGITINGRIEKDTSNPNSVAVLFSRNGKITIETDQEINAALIAMYMNPSGYNYSTIDVKGTLNLKGSLASDFINIQNWNSSVTHKISYDKNLIPNRNIYQINLSRWVTFERVIENE